MFDGRGCVRGLKDQGDDPKGKAVLLVGAGGGGGAVACGLAEAGAAADDDLRRRPGKGRAPGARDGQARLPQACRCRSARPDPTGHDLVVNLHAARHEARRPPAPAGR